VGDVRLIEERTVYAQIGDVVAYASAAVTLIALVLAWRSQSGARASHRPPPSGAVKPVVQ
jgi:hypothetical protein